MLRGVSSGVPPGLPDTTAGRRARGQLVLPPMLARQGAGRCGEDPIAPTATAGALQAV